MATGQHVSQPGGYTVDQCCLDYLNHLERRGAPDHRHTKYDLDAYVIPKLRTLQVAKLNRPKLEQWRADIAASPRRTNRKHEQEQEVHIQSEEDLRKRRATANRIMRRLQAALNLASQRGVLMRIRWLGGFRLLRMSKSRGQSFSVRRNNESFVKACAKEKDFQRLVRAALYTGARYGELGRLSVGDFNSSAGTLFIAKSKAGQQRYIHLDLEAMRFFREVCANRDPGETMFLRESGEPWAKDSQKKPMRRGCALARIQRFGFHQLRHSAASRWITLGVSLKVVAEQLGHVDTKMVERYYGHLASGHIAQTFRALPGVGLDKAAKIKESLLLARPGNRVTHAAHGRARLSRPLDTLASGFCAKRTWVALSNDQGFDLPEEFVCIADDDTSVQLECAVSRAQVEALFHPHLAKTINICRRSTIRLVSR